MPLYTLKCKRCEHTETRGFTVPGFLAQSAQGFLFISCSRCSRRGSLEHDFMADARTQSAHHDEYTFAENAPDEMANKTFSKKEAARLMKKHGLIEAGKEAKRTGNSGTRVYTEREIVEKWKEDRVAKSAPEKKLATLPENSIAAPVQAKETSPESDKKSLSLLKRANMSGNVGVDSDNMSLDTMAETWPALKKQAKTLGIPVPRSMKRPELEQLVRERITT